MVTTSSETFNHIPGGCNVLFIDGHVEFKKYTPNGATMCDPTGGGGEDNPFSTNTAWTILAAAGA